MSRVLDEGVRVSRPRYLELFAITPFPIVAAGDNLHEALREGIAASRLVVEDGDILILTHKLISRAQGRVVQLDSVVPSAEALRVAQKTNRDPRLVEVILREAKELVRVQDGHIISEHRLGHISANAGVDRSNSAEGDVVCLLPRDPDATAMQISTFIREEYGKRVAVLISDSHGRPFRRGTVGTCVGVWGLPPLLNLRGQLDLFGYTLERSDECIADELCGAANVLMGQADEGVPAVLFRGMTWPVSGAPIREVLRVPEEDIFRSGNRSGHDRGDKEET